MKRFVFFVAVLSLVLAACGGGGETPSNGATSGPVNITFWHPEAASANDNLVKLGDRFNASQNEVKVRVSFQGGYDDAMAKLVASLPTGNVPAIMFPGTPTCR